MKWWEYSLLTLSFFIGCLVLNFLVKKINEAKLEERLNRLRNKTSTNHSTQAQEPSTMEPLTSENDELSYKGISFVYNKEDNLKSTDKDNSNISSTESTKQNSKLNFLGKIYDEIKVASKDSHESNPSNKYNNHYDILTRNNHNHLIQNNFAQNMQDAQRNELEMWISELLINYVMTHYPSF